MSAGDVRCVWLDEYQRDVLAMAYDALPDGGSSPQAFRDVVDYWDAAPADPAEVLARDFFLEAFDGRLGEWEDAAETCREAWRETARDVLRALGMPEDAS